LAALHSRRKCQESSLVYESVEFDDESIMGAVAGAALEGSPALGGGGRSLLFKTNL